jgi:hypothetical protein
LSETFPQFKTGSYSTRADGTISYNDFGAGIMFIPSGLGYYAAGSASIRPIHLSLVLNYLSYSD